ncbi:Hypothetical protein GLP15_4274 [Giardia lamblia P15]|uniref:Uncharacterized protein n=1 Tax=Giardia intestinalis (strain P15) TaxID=658858 RepID=E1EY23_GIAIA|nr:Hypothetical protein GLP15_4274 [Giardia lamblia P15]
MGKLPEMHTACTPGVSPPTSPAVLVGVSPDPSVQSERAAVGIRVTSNAYARTGPLPSGARQKPRPVWKLTRFTDCSPRFNLAADLAIPRPYSLENRSYMVENGPGGRWLEMTRLGAAWATGEAARGGHACQAAVDTWAACRPGSSGRPQSSQAEPAAQKTRGVSRPCRGSWATALGGPSQTGRAPGLAALVIGGVPNKGASPSLPSPAELWVYADKPGCVGTALPCGRGRGPRQYQKTPMQYISLAARVCKAVCRLRQPGSARAAAASWAGVLPDLADGDEQATNTC